jgi:hypothetical protein
MTVRLPIVSELSVAMRRYVEGTDTLLDRILITEHADALPSGYHPASTLCLRCPTWGATFDGPMGSPMPVGWKVVPTSYGGYYPICPSCAKQVA